MIEIYNITCLYCQHEFDDLDFDEFNDNPETKCPKCDKIFELILKYGNKMKKIN